MFLSKSVVSLDKSGRARLGHISLVTDKQAQKQASGYAMAEQSNPNKKITSIKGNYKNILIKK